MSAFVELVESCQHCPLAHEDERNGRYCGHPGGGPSKLDDRKLARGCPLRHEQLIIARAPRKAGT